MSKIDSVRTLDATWKQLQSNKEIQTANISHAIDKFNDYDKFLKKLEPFMKDDDHITVKEVVENQGWAWANLLFKLQIAEIICELFLEKDL